MGEEREHDHARELRLVRTQAATLEEEVYLEALNASGLSGVPYLLSDYLARRLAQDKVKSLALTSILKEGQRSRVDHKGDRLYNLLTDDTLPFQPESGTASDTLSAMKAARSPARFGDIVFLPSDAELFVIGDTHGDLASTEMIITQITASEAFLNGALAVFMGDYVSNGLRSRENLVRILEFQQRNPDSVVLLNGNHEFRESYRTVLNEYFQVHWHLFSSIELQPSQRERLLDRLPSDGRHYGHIRLDLIRNMGFEAGERTYRAFSHWGERLPYICICGDLWLSHSLGKVEGSTLKMTDLLYAKRRDWTEMRRMGYEAWNARRASPHSAMVNNRIITSELVSEFSDLFQVDQFAVGHSHYRSGDTIVFGDASLTTVASSNPHSSDAGGYMFHEMEIQRFKKRQVENLPDEAAQAYYLNFTLGPDGKHVLHKMPIGASTL